MTGKNTLPSKAEKQEVTFIGDDMEDVVEEEVELEVEDELDLSLLDENDTTLSHEMRDQIKIAKEQAKHPKLKDGKFTHDSCYETLMFVEDQLQRAFLDFVVLGETAKQVASTTHPQLSLDFIHLGILPQRLSVYGLSTINTSLKKYGLEITDDEITFEYNDVPVKIEIIRDHEELFARPDKVFFYVTQFDTANPFDKYIEMFDNKR